MLTRLWCLGHGVRFRDSLTYVFLSESALRWYFRSSSINCFIQGRCYPRPNTPIYGETFPPIDVWCAFRCAEHDPGNRREFASLTNPGKFSGRRLSKIDKPPTSITTAICTLTGHPQKESHRLNNFIYPIPTATQQEIGKPWKRHPWSLEQARRRAMLGVDPMTAWIVFSPEAHQNDFR